MRRAFAAFAACAAVAGCYGGPGVDSPVVKRDYPLGVLDASPAPAPSGIYSRVFFGAYNCCWIQHDAAFTTMIPDGAQRERLMVSLPDGDPFATRPQTLTVRVGGGPPAVFGGLRSGIHALDVPLGRANGTGAVTVRITAAYTWAPPGRAPGSDLAAQLRSVRAAGADSAAARRSDAPS